MRTMIAGGLMLLLATTTASAIDRIADVPVTDLRALFDGRQTQVTHAGRAVRVVGEGASLAEVAEVRDESPRSRRAVLHAGDEPVRVIVVEVDDNQFAIDPFVPIDRRVTEADVRRVFGQRYLTDDLGRSTNRTRFTVRYRATEQLFRQLEDARIAWLREKGYVGSARTWTRSAPAAGAQAARDISDIEPSGIIELPADLPRTRSYESVDAGERAEPRPFRGTVRVTRGVARTPTPADAGITRISLPGRTTIITRVAETEADAQRAQAESGDVARSGDEATPASSTQQERRATRVAGADTGEQTGSEREAG